MARSKTITTDARARDMLLWARKQRISVTEITVGDVHLTLADLAIGADKKPKTDEDRRQNLYAQMGGAPFEKAMAEQEANATYEEEDE